MAKKKDNTVKVEMNLEFHSKHPSFVKLFKAMNKKGGITLDQLFKMPYPLEDKLSIQHLEEKKNIREHHSILSELHGAGAVREFLGPNTFKINIVAA